MTYTSKFSVLSGGVRGTHYDKQAYPSYVHYIEPVGGFASFIQKINVTPAALLSSGSMVLPDGLTTRIDVDGKSMDAQWSAATATLSRLFSTELSTLSGAFDSVTPDEIRNSTFSSNPISGITTGVFGAKLSTPGHYSKLHIYDDGGTTKLDWKTYEIDSIPTPAGSLYWISDPRDIVITDDGSRVYVTAVNSITQQKGVFEVQRLPFPAASPIWDRHFANTGIMINDASLPMTNPQQMALDASGAELYVASDDGVFRISTSNGTTVKMVEDLSNATGLLLGASGLEIIVSDDLGLRIIDLSNYAGSPIPASPFPDQLHSQPGGHGFLTWSDSTYSSIYKAVPNGGSVELINLTDLTAPPATIVIPPSSPWSVEVLSDCDIFIASDTELGTFATCIPVTGEWFMGIGHVPFNFIDEVTGKADTTPATGYFFRVKDVPFGGGLHLMLNHEEAYYGTARWFRVTLDNNGNTRTITDSFTELLWHDNNASFERETVAATGGPLDAYPIRHPDDYWYNPYRGTIINTSVSDNGLNRLIVDFLDDSGNVLLTKEHNVLIDNNRTQASLFLARSGNPVPAQYPVLDCGCVTYSSKNDRVEIDFSASHPEGFGSYKLYVYRGGSHLPALHERAPVSNVDTLITKTTQQGGVPIHVGDILGDCNIALVHIALRVPSYVINGYGWIDLGSRRDVHFTYVPDTVTLRTPWSPPSSSPALPGMPGVPGPVPGPGAASLTARRRALQQPK